MKDKIEEEQKKLFPLIPVYENGEYKGSYFPELIKDKEALGENGK